MPPVSWSLLKSYNALVARKDDNFSEYERRMLDEGLYGADYLARIKRPEGSFFETINAPGPDKLAKDHAIGNPNSRTEIKLKRTDSTENIVGGEGIKALWQSRWSSALSPLSRDANATQIFDHALEGDPLAQQVLQLAGRTLAYAIYNTWLVLNSPLLVLGDILGVHPALGGAVRAVLEERRRHVQTSILPSALGADA